MDNLDGRPSLLIASPQLLDPNFIKTVVLLVEHNAAGAMGFIINRPSQLAVADIIADPTIKMPPSLASWYGGPVGSEQGIIVHADPIPGVEDASLISSHTQAIEALAAYGRRHAEKITSADMGETPSPLRPTCLYPYRFVVGYAGWGEGQLEEEMVEGGWLQMPMDRDLAFNTPWLHLWQTALERLGINTSNFAPTPHSYVH